MPLLRPNGEQKKWCLMHIWGPSLVLVFVLTSQTVNSDLFTSSEKIEYLPFLEEKLLTHLDAFQRNKLTHDFQRQHELTRFISERQKQAAELIQATKTGLHPNQVYNLIKVLLLQWQPIIQRHPDFGHSVAALRSSLPDSVDLGGAGMALVRLQRVYSLQVPLMYTGNFSGFLGPSLQPEDATEIGKQAYAIDYFAETELWLDEAVSRLGEAINGKDGPSVGLKHSLAEALAQLGQVYYRKNSVDNAQKVYERAYSLAPGSPGVVQLGGILRTRAPPLPIPAPRDYMHNMSVLCSRPKTHTVSQIRPFHVCRYHSGLFVPYFRFREEILSLSPYASITYDVISDSEISELTKHGRKTFSDGVVEISEGKFYIDHEYRTSKLGWVSDDSSETARRLSERIAAITGLDTNMRLPHGPSSAEQFQVVNYGVGGHYSPHYDTFGHPIKNPLLQQSGDRLATFLLYLSDVEIGGSTVFLQAGVSVPPVKRSALFWYNYDPDLSVNRLSYHAGCPVVKGHKWIANKWIWIYGNTFRRPCGSSPDATHLEMERLLFRRR